MTYPPHYHCPGCSCVHLDPAVVLVPVASDLLAEMSKGEWSPPVHVRIERQPDGLWEMTMMTPRGDAA